MLLSNPLAWISLSNENCLYVSSPSTGNERPSKSNFFLKKVRIQFTSRLKYLNIITNISFKLKTEKKMSGSNFGSWVSPRISIIWYFTYISAFSCSIETIWGKSINVISSSSLIKMLNSLKSPWISPWLANLTNKSMSVLYTFSGFCSSRTLHLKAGSDPRSARTSRWLTKEWP